MKGACIMVTQIDGHAVAAIMRDGMVSDLITQDAAHPDLSGTVVQATVMRSLPGQKAAIISWGKAKGYASPFRDKRAGDKFLLQVKANAHAGKLPSLNADISLPGRFLVYLPLGSGINVSRRLEKTVAAKLKHGLSGILKSGGWVIRDAARQAADAQLTQEAKYLQGLWSGKGAGPVCIQPPGVAQRAVIEHQGIDNIVVTDKAACKDLQAWLRQAAPDLVDNTAFVKTTPIDLADLIDTLRSSRIDLPGGGGMVIETTAALTAIDINAGDRGDYLQVNLQAAAELARHLRLRNIGGMIVADFIRLTKPADRERLLQKLRAVVAEDPAGVEVMGFSRLGLVELVRPRRGQSLAEVFGG